MLYFFINFDYKFLSRISILFFLTAWSLTTYKLLTISRKLVANLINLIRKPKRAREIFPRRFRESTSASNHLVASVEALVSVHPADNRYSLRRFGIQIRGVGWFAERALKIAERRLREKERLREAQKEEREV